MIAYIVFFLSLLQRISPFRACISKKNSPRTKRDLYEGEKNFIKCSEVDKEGKQKEGRGEERKGKE